ncbi:hypothetical protein MMH89_00525 [Candidatus Comchoanobacter bicostacola]|uniref:phosphomannomutase n=1 Tax=Candidatus Comchoanobacter bicostacola TaxID=2919598 RepID=A0ABY5DKG7_9GAMM|nr:hypothetical protein [Candidatus Comchoanobacter bicostacola]UTC24650.1 hypothetical protein MMH89_00525 [Candidatus Comchoanobacter bicostacola]
MKKRSLLKSLEIRGRYGVDVTEQLAVNLASFLAAQRLNKVCVAMDPRPSSGSLYSCFIESAVSRGVDVYCLGIVPTPMLVKYAETIGVALCVMVTASHNPVQDNGFKVFSLNSIAKQAWLQHKCSKQGLIKGRRFERSNHSRSLYLEALPKQSYNLRRSCLVDAARGVWHYVPEVFDALNINATFVHEKNPNLINEHAAILKPNAFRSMPNADQYDLCICVDGDADRLQLYKHGIHLDGDDLLYTLFRSDPQSMVGTVLTNEALVSLMADEGHHLYRASVGDHHVYQLMNAHNIEVGGEPCGHLIHSNWLSSSDPVFLLSQLLKLESIQALPNKLDSMMLNLDGSLNVSELTELCAAFAVRQVVRKSNTENKVRVYLEGCQSEISACQSALRSHLQTLEPSHA